MSGLHAHCVVVNWLRELRQRVITLVSSSGDAVIILIVNLLEILAVEMNMVHIM